MLIVSDTEYAPPNRLIIKARVIYWRAKSFINRKGAKAKQKRKSETKERVQKCICIRRAVV